MVMTHDELSESIATFDKSRRHLLRAQRASPIDGGHLFGSQIVHKAMYTVRSHWRGVPKAVALRCKLSHKVVGVNAAHTTYFAFVLLRQYTAADKKADGMQVCSRQIF
jgi:hypothetical protein